MSGFSYHHEIIMAAPSLSLNAVILLESPPDLEMYFYVYQSAAILLCKPIFASMSPEGDELHPYRPMLPTIVGPY